MKRTLCILLSLVLTLTGLLHLGITAVFATGGTDGSISWDYDESTGTLTFSGTGAIPDYANPDKRPWRSVCGSDGCTSVVILDGVTKIGDYACYAANALETVTIAESVESIGVCAFQNCGRLLSVSLGSKVASIGGSAFSQCYKLTVVTGGNSVATIGSNAFYSCRALQSITLSGSLVSIGKYAFENCYKLQDLSIPASVKTIGERAFFRNYRMLTVSIPDGVTSIGEKTFFDCTALQTVSIPASVKNIGDHAFLNCKSLATVNYAGTEPDWNAVGKGAYVFGWLNNDATYADRAPSEMPTFHFMAASVKFTLLATVLKKSVTNSGGTVAGSGTYEKGAQAAITAMPAEGYVFDGWYSVHAVEGRLTVKKYDNRIQAVTADADVVLAALFVKATASDYTVTVTATEGGTVSGSGMYHPDQTVQLTAKADGGWHFVGWFDSGTKLSGSTNYAFDATKNVALTAKFEKDASDNPTKNGQLNVPQPATVGYKSIVTVTATASGLPGGCSIALYEGENLLAQGQDSVTHSIKKMKESKTLTARVIDAYGNVQSNAEGLLEKSFTITVKTGFFAKLKAFFQNMFGLLPKVTLNP